MRHSSHPKPLDLIGIGVSSVSSPPRVIRVAPTGRCSDQFGERCSIGATPDRRQYSLISSGALRKANKRNEKRIYLECAVRAAQTHRRRAAKTLRRVLLHEA